MEPRAVGSQRVILRTPDGTRKVAHVLHEATYLSGYILGSTSNFQVKKNGSNIICLEAMQVLTYAQPSDYLLINFTHGDEVPASAVVGGYSRDQTPLYVISAMLTAWKSGYYNTDTKQIYMKDIKSGIPAGLQLLLETIWIKKTLFWEDNPLFGLTHWDQDKMAAISQTVFSSEFLWLKTFEFWIEFHWNIFLSV